MKIRLSVIFHFTVILQTNLSFAQETVGIQQTEIIHTKEILHFTLQRETFNSTHKVITTIASY